jgi:hypothetical protein
MFHSGEDKFLQMIPLVGTIHQLMMKDYAAHPKEHIHGHLGVGVRRTNVPAIWAFESQ